MSLPDHPCVVNVLDHLRAAGSKGLRASFLVELIDKVQPIPPAIVLLRQLVEAGYVSSVPAPVSADSTLVLTDRGDAQLAAAKRAGAWICQGVTAKRVFEIDGNDFDTLDGFLDEFRQKVIPGTPWGRNLDAFNDVLRGGFGTPDAGFVLRWRNSDRSRRVLGYPETVRYLETKLGRCHPANVPSVRADIEAARRGEGQTLFDILVEIIRTHGPGGAEQDDGVDLALA